MNRGIHHILLQCDDKVDLFAIFNIVAQASVAMVSPDMLVYMQRVYVTHCAPQEP